MSRTYLYRIGGHNYSVLRRPLREVFPYYEGRGNPRLWFAFELETEDRDIVVCGVRTKRECVEMLEGTA